MVLVRVQMLEHNIQCNALHSSLCVCPPELNNLATTRKMRNQSVDIYSRISVRTWRWREVSRCAAYKWISLGEYHQPDPSSLLSHCAVSVRINMCLACCANFSAIKNGPFMGNIFLCTFLFQLGEKLLGTFKMLKKSLGEKPCVERKLICGTTFLNFNWGQWT